MIESCTGRQLEHLIDRVEAGGARYREIIICSPFIDDHMAGRLQTIREASQANNCGFRIITSAGSAAMLRDIHGTLPRRADVVVRRNLHAKVYLAVGRRTSATEAIVISANLTRAGMRENIEFGLRIANSTMEGRAVIRQIHGFLSHIAA